MSRRELGHKRSLRSLALSNACAHILPKRYIYCQLLHIYAHITCILVLLHWFYFFFPLFYELGFPVDSEDMTISKLKYKSLFEVKETIFVYYSYIYMLHRASHCFIQSFLFYLFIFYFLFLKYIGGFHVDCGDMKLMDSPNSEICHYFIWIKDNLLWRSSWTITLWIPSNGRSVILQ